MGGLTESRKRRHHPMAALRSDAHSKKLKIPSLSPHSIPSDTVALTPKMAYRRSSSLPIAPLPRSMHGPQRALKFFGVGSSNSSRFFLSEGSREIGGREFGGFSVRKVSESKRLVSGTPWRLGSSNTRPVVQSWESGLGLDEYRNLVSRVNHGRGGVGSVKARLSGPVGASSGFIAVGDEAVKVLDLAAEDEKVVDAKIVVIPVKKENEFVARQPFYKDLLEQSSSRDYIIKNLDTYVELLEIKLSAIQAANQAKEEKTEEVINEAFIPLTEEEEEEVDRALYGRNRHEVLVTHEASNIVITREIMQCLSSTDWLNDEVINVYLELLKERERREPKKFLKCHFFNTFFFKKLTSGSVGYDFKSVRRWTTQRKLGYSLIECDKIFVPIHKDIHWCLAIIDVKENKFLYLDSLGGIDTEVMEVLARYFMDEVKDKSNKQIDTSSWKQEGVADLPLQKNGWDCGMFMLKYTDFFSRGSSLCFNQDYMPYFRKRTVKEILRLRAD